MFWFEFGICFERGGLAWFYLGRIVQSLGWDFLFFLKLSFFFCFFWGGLNSAFSGDFFLGIEWAPGFFNNVSLFGLPLLNSVFLIRSRVSITFFHFFSFFGGGRRVLLVTTIFLGGRFVLVQAVEYNTAGFFIADGIFGGWFFLLTGLHGRHVVIGAGLLVLNMFILIKKYFTFGAIFFEIRI